MRPCGKPWSFSSRDSQGHAGLRANSDRGSLGPWRRVVGGHSTGHQPPSTAQARGVFGPGLRAPGRRGQQAARAKARCPATAPTPRHTGLRLRLVDLAGPLNPCERTDTSPVPGTASGTQGSCRGGRCAGCRERPHGGHRGSVLGPPGPLLGGGHLRRSPRSREHLLGRSRPVFSLSAAQGAQYGSVNSG